MYLTRLTLLIVIGAVLVPAATGAGQLLRANNLTETALAVSTGGDIVHGDGPVNTVIARNRTLQDAGDADINAARSLGCPQEAVKRLYTAMAASMNESVVACRGGPDPVNTSLSALKDRYIRRGAASGDGINHVVLSSRRMAPVAAAIAADQHALLSVIDTDRRIPADTVTARFDTDSRWRSGTLHHASVADGRLRSRRPPARDGFEDGDADGWRLRGRGAATLTVEHDTSMNGSRVASLDADGSGDKTALSMRHPIESTPEAGDSFGTWIAWTASDSHVPRIEFESRGAVTNRFYLRFDPPGDMTWCEVKHGDAKNRKEFFDPSTGDVYRVSFALHDDSVTCTVRDPSGEVLARATTAHPNGFTYDAIDRIAVDSQDETSIDVRVDDLPTGASDGPGRWDSGEMRLGEGKERLGGVRLDISSVGARSGFDAVVGALAENGSRLEQERIELRRAGQRTVDIDLPPADRHRLHLNLTAGAEIDSAALVGRDLRTATRQDNVEAARSALQAATTRLGRHGLYLGGRTQYTDGLYLSLLGVPPVRLPDPVEAGNWSLGDPADGTTYPSDLAYGDLDGDGSIDAGVGRYPANRSLASRMYLRGKYYDGKQALVASEYLHANWPTILLYIGGGMFSGKSIARILERQGYNVSRAVEYRAAPEEFLLDLTPVALDGVLAESDRVEERIGSVLGQSVGSAASQLFLALKALEYIERTLEQYLEFDWGTAGLDIERARERLSPGEVRQIGRAAGDAARTAASADSLSDGIVDVLRSEGVQHAIAEAVYAFFWPDRYPRLTADTLQEEIGGSDVVYYSGAGNRSAWILPNNASTLAGVLKVGRYNGSDALTAGNVPSTTARLVFDNSDLATARDAAMRQAFLGNGAAAYIGASTVNYAPFSSEIDTRFFRDGYTVGGSLKRAVNRFRADSLTWDPASMLARNNVKGKMLRSFRLYGNPELRKDPRIQDRSFNRSLRCHGRTCTLTLTARPEYDIVAHAGNRTLDVDADGNLVRSFRPIIPLLEAEHALPNGSQVVAVSMNRSRAVVRNISVPRTRPLAHGRTALDHPLTAGTFPRNASRVTIGRTADGRRQVSLRHAAFRYNGRNRTATVFTRINVTIEYVTPYELAVSAADTTGNSTNISVTVWNRDAVTDGELLLQVRSPRARTEQVLNVTVPRGKHRFHVRVRVNGSGRRAVDAYLLTANTSTGPRTDTFTVRDPHRSLGVRTPPRVREGARFLAQVSVTNHGAAPTTQLHVNGSPGVQPVLLQPSTTRITVPDQERRVWAVPLRAFDAGNASITARAGSEATTARFTVAGGRRDDPSTATTAADGFHMPAGQSLTVSTPEGSLHFRRGDTAATTLRTRGQVIRSRLGPDHRNVTLTTATGSARLAWTGGRRTEEVAGQATVADALAAYDLLQRERRKLLERYRIARNESPAPLH
ncbi:MAG: C25 family cysteine peptidase [Candidatus Nanohaloarchaea archaeon]|nr:C25 family cysteine peptidase [Candidatus Nanohaloarchaea archaeon]